MLPTLLILSFIAVFALLPTLYIRYVLGRQWHSRWRFLCWLPLTVVCLVLVMMMWLVTSPAFVHLFVFIVLCVVFPGFLFALISVIGWLLARRWPKALRVANYTGIVCAVICSLCAMYGTFIGWKQLTVKQVEIRFENLPSSFDGYRIVQLSDMHVGAYGDDTAFVERIVEQTNALQPDMIVFTGDLVNMNPEEIAPFEAVLSRLHAPDGVYAVLGNHDYCRYGFRKSEQQQHEGMLRVMETERRMGWQVLVDTNVVIRRGSDSIVIAGVGNISKPPYPHAGDLNKAMTGVSDSTFTVLLSHDPTHWRMEVLEQTHIPLMLAGHTHAGQLKIGSCSMAAMSYDEWGGLYEDTTHSSPFNAHRYLYVSEGLGGTLPFRLGATPQIVVITLVRMPD